MKHWACLPQPVDCPQRCIQQIIRLNFWLSPTIMQQNLPTSFIIAVITNTIITFGSSDSLAIPCRIRVLDSIISINYCTHHRHHVIYQWLSVCLMYAYVYKDMYTSVCKQLCICASQVVKRLNVMRQLRKSPAISCAQTPPSASTKSSSTLLIETVLPTPPWILILVSIWTQLRQY